MVATKIHSNNWLKFILSSLLNFNNPFKITSNDGILDYFILNIPSQLTALITLFLVGLYPYGSSPKYNSYNTSPKLHKSHLSSYISPFIISGAEYNILSIDS